MKNTGTLIRALYIVLLLSISLIINAQHKIEGTVTYANSKNSPMKFVKLILQNSVKKHVDSTYTDYKGYYLFSNRSNDTYTIIFKVSSAWGGVNPVDALMINRNYIGVYKFTDSFLQRAADVNIDSKINPVDALMINRRYIGVLKSFKAGDWLIDSNTVVVLNKDIIKNIRLVCAGDVNGSYTPNYQFVNCGDNLFDTRDSAIYQTVKIDLQCWMKDNLNIGKRINATLNQTNNNKIEKYCYNDDVNNCKTYGGLYQWDEMMQYVNTEKTIGICPAGWHLPSDNEWTILTNFLGGESVAGGKMKEAGIIHWANPNIGATDESGFTGLPGGYRDYLSGMGSITYTGAWWSSTGNPDTTAWYRSLGFNYTIVNKSDYNKADGFSVRCLKDCQSIISPSSGTNTPSKTQIIWNWQSVSGAIGYKWNTTNDFNTATDNGSGTTHTQSSLICNTLYHLYVWAYNDCGNYSSVTTLSQTTSGCK